ncbi:hypothetical protein SDC9_08881 [bioreactor metagenome]|uniref:Flagellar protein n=1 Tax=bioreactor metagenome TaxID=1076179 RepID=A0A644T909_9ZZZZ|nr:flagellar biosynthetic protein FliO [Negativicutes bacterium]
MNRGYKYRNGIATIIGLFIILSVCQVWAAETTTGGYLAYQEPQPASSSSWLSTIAYVFSLIITFAVVIGLAYFASRFLGQKMGQMSVNSDNRILSTLVLGPNRSIQVVEVAGKVIVLGVTEHSITLLEEITDASRLEKIQKLPTAVSPPNSFDSVFQRQLASLQQMSHKFPTVFNRRDNSSQDTESEKR